MPVLTILFRKIVPSYTKSPIKRFTCSFLKHFNSKIPVLCYNFFYIGWYIFFYYQDKYVKLKRLKVLHSKYNENLNGSKKKKKLLDLYMYTPH